ncbi:MAG TPA: sulfatase [Propionibacteriaceae bacterium]|nr:sulfatase [Propionibacteriaceae bacterium]
MSDCPGGLASEATRPNIVFLHWHDLGRYLRTYGINVDTPHIDALASRSVLFRAAFSAAPLCSPARGAIFTGRYPHSNGLMGLSHLGWEYHAEEVTLPMYFSAAGYTTHLIGMQHETSDPSTLGYDEFQNLNAPEQYAQPVAALAEITIRQLDPTRNFLLNVGLFEPHRPWPAALYPPVDPETVTVPGFLPDTPAVRADLAAFCGAIECADTATGRILSALGEREFAHPTIIVFTTDHGIAFPGAKSTLHDAGIEVSLIMSVPGGPAGIATDRLVSHVDILPTLLDLAGLPVPRRIQGRSFADEFTGAPGYLSRTSIFAEKNWHDPDDYDPVRAIRTSTHKLIVSYEERDRIPLPGDIAASASARAIAWSPAPKRARRELYDLVSDPYEQVNLADSRDAEGVYQSLSDQLEAVQRETGDPILDGPIPAPRAPGRLPAAIRSRTRPIDPETGL